MCQFWRPGATFLKLLRKILEIFLIFDNIWKSINPDIISLYLLIHDLTTMSRNSIQRDAEIKVLITIIIALLFPNL